MSEIKKLLFQNEEFGQIRTAVIDDVPWFVAADVCAALEIANTTDAIKRLDDDEKARFNLGLPGGDTNCVNEYGLYSLVLGSKKKEAKTFKRWITHDVIPQIRKTGSYHLPQTYQDALRELADKVEENEKLAAENEKLLPKAAFFDAVTDSKTAISIGEVAKVLDMGIGQNKLFAFLRERKILDSKNIPYQEYIDRGYFRTIEQKYDVRGEVRISIKTLVFQKGIDFIRKQLQKEEV